MKGFVKLIGIFIAGAAAGGAGSYFFMSKQVKKKENEMNEAIVDIRKYYDDKIAKLDPPAEEEANVKKVDGPAIVKETKVHKTDRQNAHKEASFVREERPDYTSFFRKREHPEDDEPEESEEQDDYDGGEAITKDHESNRNKPPKPIKAVDFGQDPSYETVTLYYYIEDGALVLEDQTPFDDFPNEQELLGDALDKFGFKDDDDESEIYVRNYARQTDYEVIKVYGAYNE